MTTKDTVLTTLGQLTEQGRVWLTREDILTVRASVDLHTQITGVIIPQGTIGKVLYADFDNIIIDFGLATVHRLPIDTDLISPLDTPVIEVT